LTGVASSPVLATGGRIIFLGATLESNASDFECALRERIATSRRFEESFTVGNARNVLQIDVSGETFNHRRSPPELNHLV
jgi:hypothetical protein